MHFRRVLLELDRIESELGRWVTASEFTDHCSAGMSVSNARVYLLRLFKMNLARRRKNRNVGATNHPYEYIVSKTGRKYIQYLASEHYLKEVDIVDQMSMLIDMKEYDKAVQLYEKSENVLFHEEWKEIAREYYRSALELDLEELRRNRQRRYHS